MQELQRIVNKISISKIEINQYYTQCNSEAEKAKYKNISAYKWWIQFLSIIK